MKRYTLPIIILCGLLIAFGSSASAASVTINPEHIEEKDTITIAFSGLSNGSAFALHMESAIELNGGNTFTYQANQVSVPFSMNNPRVTLLASPVTEAGIEASDGGTIKRMTQRTATGSISIIESLGAIPSGTMEVLKAFGTTTEGAEYVDITLELSGTKQGPDSGSITFGLEGISDGSATIIVLVDGAEATNKRITIGTPTITPTPTVTKIPSSGGGGGSDNGPSTTTPANSVIASSLDGTMSLETVATSITGASADDIRIIRTEPRNIPDDWVAVGGAYVISPAAARFMPAARLTFEVDEGNRGTFLGSYADGVWSIVPTWFVGADLVAEITGAGQYGLMTYAANEPVATSVTPEVTVPQTNAVPQATAVVTTTTAVPQTEKAAGGWLGLFGALTVGALLIVHTKRSGRKD
jgi:hypothetical protein